MEQGVCGQCPTMEPSIAPTQQPSLTPTQFPSGVPTQPPTDPLEGCEIEPPSCSIAPDGGADSVVFCVEFGDNQREICVPVERVQNLIDLGKDIIRLVWV